MSDETEDFEEATDVEYMASNPLTKSRIEAKDCSVLALIDNDGKPRSFMLSYGKAGSLVWSDGAFAAADGPPVPAWVPVRLARSADRSVDPQTVRLIVETIKTYPLFKPRLGGAGQPVNRLALRREPTDKQALYWVFDDSDSGLRSVPLLLCQESDRTEVLEDKERPSRNNYRFKAFGHEWPLWSPIEEVASLLGTEFDTILFSFSSRGFPGSQGVLRRKTVYNHWPYTKYRPVASSIGALRREWFFAESLLMCFKRYPRQMYFKVERDQIQKGESADAR